MSIVIGWESGIGPLEHVLFCERVSGVGRRQLGGRVVAQRGICLIAQHGAQSIEKNGSTRGAGTDCRHEYSSTANVQGLG